MASYVLFPEIVILKKLYTLYEQTLSDIPLVCEKTCADCCTCNVTVTSLEAAFMVHSLDAKALAGVRQGLTERFPLQRYIPKMTLNQFAGHCLSEGGPPQEENNPDWGQCPILEADLCTLYPVRPFGCRSMMSQVYCRNTGYAQVPPLALTQTHIFLQYIEHLDFQGFSGNLADMLAFYLDKRNLDLSGGGNPAPGLPNPVPGYLSFEIMKRSGKTETFIQNMKIQGLMVPPEHRAAVSPLLKQIAALT